MFSWCFEQSKEKKNKDAGCGCLFVTFFLFSTMIFLAGLGIGYLVATGR